jgi:hypothetical protein
MAELKSETGNDAFSIIGTGLYIIVGLWLGLAGFEMIGIRVPVDQPDALRFVEFLGLGAVGCVALHVVLAALSTFMQAMLTMAMTSLGIAVDTGERLGAKLALVVKALLRAAGRLALASITLPFRALKARVVGPMLERRRQMAELQKIYAQVKDQYASFDAFLAAFNSGTGPETQNDGSEAPADPYVEALALFGFAADCAITSSQFKAEYRKRMKEAHPDKAGNNALATKLNEARDLINARKGWKR